MPNTTKSRADLKKYFLKNAVPTESNFGDLIDGQLNQADDGVFKLAGEPLSVVAAGGEQKRVLRLYSEYPATNPDWLISLKPAQDPSNAATNRPGFGLADGTGNTRLFLDAAGNLGLGTNEPQGAIDVRIGGNSTDPWKRFVVTTSSAWGEAGVTHVTIGAGGAAGIMLANPHVPWYAQDSRASIRYGRIGGAASGSYWDVGARSDGNFSFSAFNKNNNTETQLQALVVSKTGDVTAAGAATIQGIATIQGAATIASATIQGTATIQGAATIASATIQGTATIQGAATIASATIQGAATFQGLATLNGGLDVRIAGSTDAWKRFVVTASPGWGDANTTHVTIGAGGAAGIMLANPHVPWYTGEPNQNGRASIRYGRIGGTANGSYWDVGARSDGNFSFIAFNKNNNTETQVQALVVSKTGDLTTTGAATIQGTATINGIANLPGGLQFMGVGDGVTNHIESDGALYRKNGWCYLTVDDYLHFRKPNTGDNWTARLRVDTGDLVLNGGLTVQGTANLSGGLQFMGVGDGVTNHIESDGALYRKNGWCYLTVDDYLHFRKPNTGDNWTARLRVDTGDLVLNGGLTVQGTANLSGGLQFMGEGNGLTSHIEKDGALYRKDGQCYLTFDDYLYFRKAGSSTGDNWVARLRADDTPITLSLTRGLQLGEWAIVPDGDKLYIKKGDSIVARFSTSQDRFNIFKNCNGIGPYWYWNSGGGANLTGDTGAPP